MKVLTVPFTSRESLRGQNSQPDPNPTNTPSDNGATEKEHEGTILNTWFSLIALIGVLLSGFATAAILSDANHLRATNVGRTYNSDFIEFWQIVVVLSGILFILGVISSKRICIIGNGILCPLIFICGLARTSNHFFILRTLIGILLAVILGTFLRFVDFSAHSPGLIRYDILFGSATALIIGPLCAGSFGIRLRETFSWQWSFFIIAAISGVLFALTITGIVPPLDVESQELRGPLLMFQSGLIYYWIYVASFTAFLGQIFYKVA